MIKSVYVTLLVSAAPIAAPAMAQTAPAPAVADPADTAQAGPATPTGATANSGDLADVIVTARRRSERLQDVPLTIQAVSQQALDRQGITRTEDLRQVVPSLTITPSSQGRADIPIFEIRGISSDEALLTQDQSVALYFNEVVQARPAGTNQQLYDLENVQVLSGPQGTLFGRNSVAGALLFTSRRPTRDWEGEISATYGNYDRRELRAILNIPLSDTLQVRFAGQRLLRDGYTNVVNLDRRIDNTDVYTGRASVLWEPVHGLSNLTVVDYYRSRNNGYNNELSAVRQCTPAAGVPAPFNVLAGTPPIGCLYGPVGNAVLGTGDIFGALALQQSLGPRRVQQDQTTFSNVTAFGVANITTLELNNQFTLKNIFGYRRTTTDALTDLEGTIVAIGNSRQTERARQFSNELQLQGRLLHNTLDLIVGGYYFRETGFESQNSLVFPGVNPNLPIINQADVRNLSHSVFGQVTYHVPFLTGLSLTAGGRYTWDRRRVEQLPGSTIGPAGTCILVDAAGVPLNPCDRLLNTSSHEPTYTFAIDYKVTPAILLYGTTRRGYRSGGFTFRGNSPGETQPFRPEIVTDYEAGFKADFNLGGEVRLRTNADYYHIDYTDIQRTVAFFNSAGTIAARIDNAAAAKIDGFEASVGLQLVRGFEVSGYGSHYNGRYTAFNTIINGVPTVLGHIPFTGSDTTLGAAVSLTPIDNEHGTVNFSAAYSYQSAFYSPNALPDIEPESRVPGQSLLNLTASWNRIEGTGFSATVFVRNALNEDYIVGSLSLEDALGFTTRTYGEPRMYGLTLRYAFGPHQ